jgi:hypothetical protein
MSATAQNVELCGGFDGHLVLFFFFNRRAIFAHDAAFHRCRQRTHILCKLLLLHFSGIAHVEILAVNVFIIDYNHNLFVWARLYPSFRAMPIGDYTVHLDVIENFFAIDKAVGLLG